MRRLLWAGVVVLLALMPVPALAVQLSPDVHAQDSDVEGWAVIIGVSDYEHFHPWQARTDLTYPDDDARALHGKLSRYWGDDHTKLLLDSEATKADIETALTEWLAAREGAEDVVLLFFAGHACKCPYHKYLSPYDALPESHANDIVDTQLSEWLSGLDSDRVIVVLDTCYAAGFFNELGRAGRVVLAAAAAEEQAFDCAALGHGVFSYYLLQGLDNPWVVDANADNQVSAEELFHYIRDRVAAHSEGHISAQRPQLYDGYEGELVLFSMTPRGLGSINPPVEQGDSRAWYIAASVAGALLAAAAAVWVRRRRQAAPAAEDGESG